VAVDDDGLTVVDKKRSAMEHLLLMDALKRTLRSDAPLEMQITPSLVM